MIPILFKGKKRVIANELIEKYADFSGYGVNIWASFYLARIRGLGDDQALIYGAVSIIMHLIWKEVIYKKIKQKHTMRA